MVLYEDSGIKVTGFTGRFGGGNEYSKEQLLNFTITIEPKIAISSFIAGFSENATNLNLVGNALSGSSLIAGNSYTFTEDLWTILSPSWTQRKFMIYYNGGSAKYIAQYSDAYSLNGGILPVQDFDYESNKKSYSLISSISSITTEHRIILKQSVLDKYYKLTIPVAFLSVVNNTIDSVLNQLKGLKLQYKNDIIDLTNQVLETKFLKLSSKENLYILDTLYFISADYLVLVKEIYFISKDLEEIVISAYKEDLLYNPVYSRLFNIESTNLYNNEVYFDTVTSGTINIGFGGALLTDQSTNSTGIIKAGSTSNLEIISNNFIGAVQKIYLKRI